MMKFITEGNMINEKPSRLKLFLEIHEIKGGTKTQREFYKLGAKLCVDVMNTLEFHSRIANFQYMHDGIIISHFKNNYQGKNKEKLLSNDEILDILLSGYDQYSNNSDGDLDIKAKLYFKRFSKAKGYTYPSTLKTWINTKFWTGSFDEIIAGIAANIGHENCHNADFQHAFKSNPTRKYTVPYGVGTAIYEIALELLSKQSDQYHFVCKRSFFGTKCKWVEV